MEHWLRTDEEQQAVLALRMASEQLLQVTMNPHHWQWVIIGLHIALQGFMVLALQGSNSLNVLTDECAKEWMAAYERGNGKYPERRLASFLDLYERIKSDRMKMYLHSQSFRPSSTQDRSVKELNSLRNEFIHFVPKGWSLEVSGLPQIVADCLDVISFLAFECSNIVWHDAELESQTKELIENARCSVSLIKTRYGA